jgi:hypothetical protein
MSNLAGEPSLLNQIITVEETPTLRVRRRASTTRQLDIGQGREHGNEECKASVSSRDSWIRRLSIIGTSRHSSPRSSVGPDSPSLSFSHGSAAPILHIHSSPGPVEPNKLVKRITSIRAASDGTPIRPGTKSSMPTLRPTLRRPATSHQRTVTLQQQFREHALSPQVPLNEQEASPVVLINRSESSEFTPSRRKILWRPYFESRPTKIAKERPSGRPHDDFFEVYHPNSRRVQLPESSVAPTLLKPSMIDQSPERRFNDDGGVKEFNMLSLESEDNFGVHTSDTELHKRPRQSISMHFSSPTSWIPRSGSLRGSRRRGSDRNPGKRYVSAPVSSTRRAVSSHATYHYQRSGIMDSSMYSEQGCEEDKSEFTQNRFEAVLSSQTRARNSSSPLPPLSRLSSFNLDLSRLGLSSSSSNTPNQLPTSPASPNFNRPTSRATSGEKFQALSSHPVVIHQQWSPRLTELNASDRGSTLVGSDSEARGFGSGEEDEMDFQSDTAYDSFRTGATASIRARNTPLESMFDESPPSSGTRSKKCDYDDMALNAALRNADNSIVEEDEGMITPIKSRRRLQEDVYSTPVRQSIEVGADDLVPSSPPSFCLATKEFSRPSLGDEEDEDEDWTRDDESILFNNPLSPPTNSANSLRVSPALRAALADVTLSESPKYNCVARDERPKSIFDWSEPSMQEKGDGMGNSPRPKTVHGKQSNDGRGGRAGGRRGPSALHIRSQSVPAVPDVAGHRDQSKLANKFGTWGLGAKGVSEDWDNDFVFDGADIDMAEDGNPGSSGCGAMFVPPAIQASQANVVGHVGQIREICALVADLKRLRGLAREKGLLEGKSSGLWREAEGIIALAIPDEEDIILSPPQSPTSSSADRDVDDGQRVRKNYENEYNDFSTYDEKANARNHSTTLPKRRNSRRRSVLSPGDDIFGSVPTSGSREDSHGSSKSSRNKALKDSTEVARSVMEHMHQHRATSDPVLSNNVLETPNKMPFDTTSLRDLVQRASTLNRLLADIIRKSDGISLSPNQSPRAKPDSSPAFTRVFTDPMASPPKNMIRTQSNNSVLSSNIDSSPTRSLGQRLQMMTVV